MTEQKPIFGHAGLILFILLTGYLLFHNPNVIEMYWKIGKAEFKFPNLFAPDVRRLISKILDPNPSTRISLFKIMESSWFRQGLDSKSICITSETKEPPPLDTNAIFGPDSSSGDIVQKQELSKMSNLNAFNINSYSPGFDLSGLFEGMDQRKEARFMAKRPASTIISKLEEIARRLRLKVKKKDGGIMQLERSRAGRKGVLGIDGEIFEITPDFHLVEMKKTNGEADIRPVLKEIIWAWQGELSPSAPPQQIEQDGIQQSQPSQVAVDRHGPLFHLSVMNF